MLRCVALVAVVALAATLAAAAHPKWHQLNGYSFTQYKKDFHKKYHSAKEHTKRQAAFEENLLEIQSWNANPSHSWKKGVNHMADRTKEELKRMNGGKSASMLATKARLEQEHKPSTNAATGAPLPDAFDWRNRVPSVLTGIKDQGECGDCWAHGATEAIETSYAIKTGELYVLSQQQVTSCSTNPDDCGGTGGCGGSIAELAFDYVVKNGIAEEWTYPFTSGVSGETGVCQNNSISPVVFLDGYVKNAVNDQVALMQALIAYGPMAINVDASGWSFYESGVFNSCNYTNNVSIDHVVQLVGWGYDLDQGMGYWVVRNSWSPAWGDNGFIHLQRDMDATHPACGWNVNTADGTACKPYPQQQWVCGQCAILFDTSFPLVKV